MSAKFLLLVLLVSAPMMARGVDELDEEDEEDPVTYQCDPAELLIVYNKSDDEVRMHCSPPPICGMERTCVSSTAPACEAKSRYLGGVQEEPDGSVISTCCQITPPFDGDEPCYEVEVDDQSVQGEEGGLFKTGAPGAKPPAGPGPVPRVAASRVRPATPRPIVPPPVNPSQSGPSKTYAIRADLMLVDLHDRRPPIELVKGIYKTPKGYKVKICTPQCRTTTSTVTVTSTSRKPTTTEKPSKPTQQYDEHGTNPAGGTIVEKDGRIIRTLGGNQCQNGFDQCQAQCRAISGSRFITASCRSADGTSSSSSSDSPPSTRTDGDGRSRKHAGSKDKGSKEKSKTNGQSSSGNIAASTDITGPQQQVCVCTERKGDTNTNPNAPPPGRKGLGGRLGNGHGCFSGDMMVETPKGQKRMDELHVGDQVLVLTAESDAKYQPIEWFYHRDIDHVIEFVTLKTKSGRTLSLTPNHMIPLVPCVREKLTLKEMDMVVAAASFFASKARVGHCVAVADGDRFLVDPILRVVRERRRGIFSPITNQGTIVVNGVQTSCYSSLENQAVQRTIHSLLIKANRMTQAAWRWISGAGESNMEVKDVPTVLAFFLEVAKTVLPGYVYP